MMDLNKFQLIKEKYGHYASWAIWAEEGLKPKDNMGDTSILDISQNKTLLEQLKPNIVFVGFNISKTVLPINTLPGLELNMFLQSFKLVNI